MMNKKFKPKKRRKKINKQFLKYRVNMILSEQSRALFCSLKKLKN